MQAFSKITGILRSLSQPYEAEFATLTGQKPKTDGSFETYIHDDPEHKAWLLYDQAIPIGFAIKGTKEQWRTNTI